MGGKYKLVELSMPYYCPYVVFLKTMVATHILAQNVSFLQIKLLILIYVDDLTLLSISPLLAHILVSHN